MHLFVATRCEIFQLEIHQIPFGGRAPPGPAGGAKALPRPPSRNKGPTSKGRGRKGMGGEAERKGKGRGNLIQAVRGIDAPERSTVITQKFQMIYSKHFYLSFLQPFASYAPSQLQVSRGAKHGGTSPHQMYVDLRQRRPLRLHKTTFSIACIRRHHDSVILRSGDLGFRLIHINEMLSRRE